MKEYYERENAHYLVTDLSTGKSWESVSQPQSIGWDNITFKTSDNTGVILHNVNITIKRLP